MGYLDQLKNISDVPGEGPKEPKKPQETGCLGLLGPAVGVFEKTHGLESSSRWLLHFPDRESLTVTFSPAASHAEVLASYPDALAAEPIEPGQREPGTMLAADQESRIRSWLAQIGETDEATIDDVLTRCQRDEDAREYYLGRAGEEHTDEDRRRCTECGNLRGWVCGVATPGGLVSANRGYRHAPDTLQRCAGYLPNGSDKDQRAGRERWPGLTD